MSDLLLRPWRMGDAAQLLAIAARSPDLERQLPYAIDSEAAAAQWIGEMSSEPGRHVFAIEHEGLAVGTVALSARAGSDVAWVWYWVDSAARGRGLVTRALVRLCQWAFARRGGGFRRLELGYRVNNPASAAVAARAGFVVEGCEREKFVIDGYAVDVRTAARLRSDPAPELDVSDVGFECATPRDRRRVF